MSVFVLFCFVFIKRVTSRPPEMWLHKELVAGILKQCLYTGPCTRQIKLESLSHILYFFKASDMIDEYINPNEIYKEHKDLLYTYMLSF